MRKRGIFELDRLVDREAAQILHFSAPQRMRKFGHGRAHGLPAAPAGGPAKDCANGPTVANLKGMADEPSQSPVEAPRIVVVPRGQVVVRPGEVDRARAIARQLAWFMDNSFEVPGTRYRIGFDPLI